MSLISASLSSERVWPSRRWVMLSTIATVMPPCAGSDHKVRALLLAKQRLPAAQQHQLPEQALYIVCADLMNGRTVPAQAYLLRLRVHHLQYRLAVMQSGVDQIPRHE